MNSFWIHIIHQAIFGGIASAGFGILFNCSPRIILHCMGSGALAAFVHSLTSESGFYSSAGGLIFTPPSIKLSAERKSLRVFISRGLSQRLEAADEDYQSGCRY